MDRSFNFTVLQVMLILILISVHYLQNIVSSFQEDSNCHNHSFQIPTTQDFPHPTGGIFSLKKHWRWEYINTSKILQGGNIFLRKYIISKSVMENNTTSKRKASLQYRATLSAGIEEGVLKNL